jgi:hypothetical protein
VIVVLTVINVFCGAVIVVVVMFPYECIGRHGELFLDSSVQFLRGFTPFHFACALTLTLKEYYTIIK